MSKLGSPEHLGSGAEKLTIVALFAGAIAIGASLFKYIFTPNKKSKRE